METSALANLIGSYGFPIVACCAMFWELHQSGIRHQEEVEKLREALESNTLVMTRLCERIEGAENE